MKTDEVTVIQTAGLRRARAMMGIGLGLCMCVCAGVCVDATSAGPDSGEDVLQAGNYQLRTRILHAGTRSEGRIGRLFRDGIEVPGRTPGEAIDVTTLAGTVRFTYLGQARPHLWSISGWTDRAPPR